MIKNITFEDVHPIWKELLWPGRQSPIHPVSAIDFTGNIDMSIKNETASFWGFYKQNQLTGVISGFLTSPVHYRARGLFILEAFRNQGQAQALLEAVETQAILEGAKLVWSLPRKSAWPVYEKYGFEPVSQWIYDKFEFGPNCFASKFLKK